MNRPNFDYTGPYSNNVSYPELSMYPPHPPPMMMNPILVDPSMVPMNVNPAATNCQHCGRFTNNISRSACGCTALTWGLGLLLVFPPLFWLPCCVSSMRDTRFICSNCGNVKSVIPARCVC